MIVQKDKKCEECGSDVVFDNDDGSHTLLHETDCSKHKAVWDKIEKDKQQKLEKRRRTEMVPEDKVAESKKIRELKDKFDGLMSLVSTSLITVDWVLKLGLAVGVFLFPVEPNRWIQSIGILSYVVILTLVSKAIVKVKSYKLD